MNDNPSEWLDWLAVFGYISFTAFIIWQIFTSKPPKL